MSKIGPPHLRHCMTQNFFKGWVLLASHFITFNNRGDVCKRNKQSNILRSEMPHISAEALRGTRFNKRKYE